MSKPAQLLVLSLVLLYVIVALCLAHIATLLWCVGLLNLTCCAAAMQ